MPKLDQVLGGKIKINGREYNLVEIKHGGTGNIIWPLSYTYVLSNLVIVYSSGNKILASGGNYAYVTATVQTYQGSTLIRTDNNVVVTPTLSSSTHFYVSGKYIYGYNLGTTEVTSGYSVSVSATYETSSSVAAGSVTQQTNTPDSLAVNSVSVTCDPEKDYISPIGGNTDCYGTLTRYVTYTWTSGGTSTGSDHLGNISVYLDGTYKGQIAHNGYYNVSFDENQSLQERSKVIKFAYSADTSKYDSDTIMQDAGYYTYSTPVISSYSCEDVPASGGTSYFWGRASQTYGWNGRESGVGTISPSVTWSVESYYGSNLGTDVKGRTMLGSSVGSCTSHGKSAATVTAYCYQEANERFNNGSTISEKHYGTPVIVGEETRNQTVSIFANQYTTISSPCPASGGNSTISYSATYDSRNELETPWYRTITYYYTYTSGAESSTTQDYDQGKDSSYTPWTTQDNTSSVTISGTAAGFSYDSNTKRVTIDNRHKNVGDARSCTYTANIGGIRATVTIYQQENRAYETRTPHRSVSINYSGDIPYQGGTYTASYSSYDTIATTYTSDDRDNPYNQDMEVLVSGTNCTPEEEYVSGTGTLNFTIPANTGSSDRTVTIYVDTASDSRTQSYPSAVYTFELRYYGTVIHDNDEIEDSEEIELVDYGNNLRQYTITKLEGDNIQYGVEGNKIYFDLHSGDAKYQVTEASSGGSVMFYLIST